MHLTAAGRPESGLAFRPPTTPSLPSVSTGEIVNLIGSNIKNQLASTSIAVPDRHRSRVLLVNQLTGEVTYENRLTSH
jgi:hypothetical protein